MSKKKPRSKPKSEITPRTPAEWVSLAIAVIVLAGVVGTVVYLWASNSSRPPGFRIDKLEITRQGEHFYLPVIITNEGDMTGAQVTVEGRLDSGGEQETATTTLDFLPGHSKAEAVLIFSNDPANAEVRVVSYQQP